MSVMLLLHHRTLSQYHSRFQKRCLCYGYGFGGVMVTPHLQKRENYFKKNFEAEINA